MALATQCPHCQTTFRVAHDQLKLRAGLVRCGACKQIFNGIENLLRPEEMEQVLPPTAAPHPAAPAKAPQVASFTPPPSSVNAEKPAATASTSPVTADVSDGAAAQVSPSPEYRVEPSSASAELTPPIDFTTAGNSTSSSSLGQADVVPAETPSSVTFQMNPRYDGPSSFTADSRAGESEAIPAERPSNDPLLRMTLLDVAHRGPLQRATSTQETDSETDSETEPGSTGLHPSTNAAWPEETTEPENVQRGEQTERIDQVEQTGLVRKSAEPLDDGLEKTIDDLQAKPWRNPDARPDPEEHDPLDQADIREYEEPSFVRQGRRRQRLGKATRILMLVCIPVLLLALIIQVAYSFRNHLLARWPQTQPMLAALCQPLQCELGLPAQIEQVALESSELQAAVPADGTLHLTALLRNQSGVAQTWPHLELTLNDSNEKPIARRVITPRDYLPSGTDLTKGFPAKSEQAVKMRLELDQLKASGFRVYLFYP